MPAPLLVEYYDRLPPLRPTRAKLLPLGELPSIPGLVEDLSAAGKVGVYADDEVPAGARRSTVDDPFADPFA